MKNTLSLIILFIQILIFISLLLGLLYSLEYRFNKSILVEHKKLREEKVAAMELNNYLLEEVSDLIQYQNFKKALEEIDERDYDKKDNNCYDHSLALQDKLRALGIESTIAIAENREHAFLMVWVEATSGEFISPSLDYNLIEFRSSEYDVICNNE